MAEFYSARGWEIPPLPWTNLSPPFSGRAFRSNLRFARAHCALRLPSRRTRRAGTPDMAPDSNRRTSCVAGAGFAAHQASHRAVQRCPHSCGHHCRRLRQRAVHDCLRLLPRRPPLKRRGGSLPPAALASIPPSLIPQVSPFRTARGGFGFHTRRIVDAGRAMADHGCDRLASP